MHIAETKKMKGEFTMSKGNKMSERVVQMKNGFMSLHQKGYSISQIAETYSISSTCVYMHLDEIAAENHVTRDELLKNPSMKGLTPGSSGRKHILTGEEMDETLDEFRTSLDEADKSFEKISDSLTSKFNNKEEN